MGDKIEVRLAELLQARERYAADANRQLGAYDGAIAELRRLIGELVADESPEDTVEVGR